MHSMRQCYDPIQEPGYANLYAQLLWKGNTSWVENDTDTPGHLGVKTDIWGHEYLMKLCKVLIGTHKLISGT